MANPSEWGPILWKIIHITCEHIGKNNNVLLQNDEIHAVNQFIKMVGSILPCKICRMHYNNYYKRVKKDVEYNSLKEYTKQYYYNLHDEINKEKGLSSAASISYDMLENTYKPITKEEYNTLIKEAEVLFKKYILFHFIHVNAVRDFFVSLKRIRTTIYF